MVEYRIDRAPADCYAAFNTHEQMRLWLPDLKRLKVVSTDDHGRLKEAVYEMGESLTFALVYAYDDDARRVRWVPSAGVLDGVSGSASFEWDSDGAGTRFTYALDSLRGRTPDHEHVVARAFVEWMNRQQPRRPA